MNLTRRRKAAFTLMALLLGLALAGATAEGVTRVAGLAPPLDRQCREFVADPILPYRPKPFSRGAGTAATGEYEFSYEHNSAGFRDIERQQAKPTGTFRILGLGDSFTYGMGASYEDTYLARLEARLHHELLATPVATDVRAIEVIKAGIPGYYPEPERLLLEHYGLAYEPDLVLVGFVPNDVADAARGLHARVVDADGGLKTKAAADLGWIINRLALCSHFCRLSVKKYADWRSRQHEGAPFAEIYRPGGPHEVNWLKVEAELQRMQELCAQAGARLVVVHIPQQGPWNASHAYPAERLAALASASGFACVDALPAMRAQPNAEELYYRRDGHCTPAGYAVIAEVIADFLLAHRTEFLAPRR